MDLGKSDPNVDDHRAENAEDGKYSNELSSHRYPRRNSQPPTSCFMTTGSSDT